MRFYSKIFLLMLGFFGGGILHAQDVNFSQFYEMPLLRNPALAGIFAGDFRVTAAYRNQWQSVTTPYQTQALGVEFKKSLGENSDDFLTLGLQFTNDKAGDSKLSKTQVFPVLNFHKSLNGDRDTYISAGIMAGAVQHRFDPTKLTFDDQYINGAFDLASPTKQMFDRHNMTYWDIAAGLSYSSVIGSEIRYYLGLGLFHFTQPKVAFTPNNDIKLNPKWVVNMGVSAPVSDWDKLILYGDYFSQGGARLAQGGFLYSHTFIEYDEETISLAGGAFYRWNDAVIPVLRFDYYNLGVGVSYDVNVSNLSAASQMRGGLEVSLSYKTYLNITNTSLNKVRCVQF